MASKYVEQDSFVLDIVSKRMAFDRFNAAEIKLKELEILKAINFDLDLLTTYEFIEMLFLDFLSSHEGIIDNETLSILEQIKKQSVYYSVMCCYNYDMLQYK